ncbi:nucleic-acid-binding protein from transposon X-element [Caerostris darwini]|uniref:Nucleic-acid-binding protein from transposon X-element n=1 Tax=Caerostris darwini TaxID=1538125 RepID=A0AAV4V4V4_9ARAC|nr:nucleic-acid-binding protein from transposon X-element [Caerostris darwini]
MPQNSSRPPGDSQRVTVPPGAQLPSSITPPASTTSNPSTSATAKATATMESMDVTTDTSPDNMTTVFPAITETVVDISIRSALHYLHYKEILMAAEDILHNRFLLNFTPPVSPLDNCSPYGNTPGPSLLYRTFLPHSSTIPGRRPTPLPLVTRCLPRLDNRSPTCSKTSLCGKRRRQSAAKANPKHTTAEIALQNSFAVLSDTDSDATPDTHATANLPPNQQFPKLTQKQRQIIKNSTTSKSNVPPKKHFPAHTNPKTSPTASQTPATPANPNVRPIMIMKPTDIHAFMKQLNDALKLKITCKLTAQYLKLEPDTESLHATITKHLDATNVPYYIITPKGLRPVKAVLRGLPISTDLEAIKNELTELNFQVINIYQLKKRDQARTPMPLFQIQLAPTENVEEIWQLDSLLFTKINVEKYNNKGGISQCHRCQLFGHSSINCKLPIKCVKCAGHHLTKDCTITNHTDTPVCANCQGSHPASYRGCPKFPKLNQSTNKQSTNPVSFTSNFTKPNISYSAMASTSSNSTNDTPSLLTSLKEAVFDSEILLLLQVIKTVLPAIKNATNPYDKMYALIKAASDVFDQASA